MAQMDRHCRIVSESLTGERSIDEQTHASLAVLTERLERLQHSSSLFAGVRLSRHAQRLKRLQVMPVG